jgi:hypothetical protein
VGSIIGMMEGLCLGDLGMGWSAPFSRLSCEDEETRYSALCRTYK